MGREPHQALILRNKARYDPRATFTKDDEISITKPRKK
ncbi:MAG: hypothetical protein AOA65_1667 [Candidatus Bathyarchaeota archaeon BA1]|nr:MAG: hypothetical protein AOA65_1667 [Candidatus Bathyarchaeota archaeon BA1]